VLYLNKHFYYLGKLPDSKKLIEFFVQEVHPINSLVCKIYRINDGFSVWIHTAEYFDWILHNPSPTSKS